MAMVGGDSHGHVHDDGHGEAEAMATPMATGHSQSYDPMTTKSMLRTRAPWSWP